MPARAAGFVIDPKDYWATAPSIFVNILRDPDEKTALIPGRFARQVDVIAEAAALDRHRLLQWTLAFTSLSAVWILTMATSLALDLAVAELAAALKNKNQRGKCFYLRIPWCPPQTGGKGSLYLMGPLGRQGQDNDVVGKGLGGWEYLREGLADSEDLAAYNAYVDWIGLRRDAGDI